MRCSAAGRRMQIVRCLNVLQEWKGVVNASASLLFGITASSEFLAECTFIVLETERWSGQAGTEEDCMVGDVNLFLTDMEDPTVGEIEVMIAEPSCRGRGFGKETTLIMMFYGVTKLGITKFEAKVGQENEASICMFKKLNFKEVAVNRIFQEVTLRLDVNEQQKQWLLEQTNHVEEKHYSVNLQTRASET
ncbi:alpha/beta-tubulin-N-acetyltransferase 9 isoform X3 [Caretta caretta]|uniref:alpha/beta-tubulin-N-acetyltransferase 9 isoform X3 n=1 Tax=Caretta caretta TaxID=8467 RepID=UPI002094F80C|nr:alpha/beta-tubulin-N-acetyltransferase 9 isoform X3 [Caretta caretta]